MTFEEKIKAVESFFEKEHIRMEKLKSNNDNLPQIVRYKGVFPIEKGAFKTLTVVIVLDDRSVQTFVYYPVFAKGHETDMAEFLVRTNYNLRFGDLNMDYEDGELRYHFSQSLAMFESEKFQEWFAHQFYLPIGIANHFSYGINAVISNTMSAEQAFQHCFDENKVQKSNN